MLNDDTMFENLNHLNKYKKETIEFIEKNNFDGKKLTEIKKKTFKEKITKQLNNKKISGDLIKLYNKIIKYNIPKTT